MIVYGWGNFNRRDHSLVRGTCSKCGHTGYKRSYTSSKFFTLYFVPVIPLGRQKIVSECPNCKQAWGMSLGKWRKLRSKNLPDAVAAYEADPTDEEKAKTAIGAIVQAQDEIAMRRIGPHVQAAFARNEQMLALLASAYSLLCLDREADAVYLEAVGLSNDEHIAAEANAHIELQKHPKPTPPNRILQSLPVLIVPAIILFLLATYAERTASSRPDDAWIMSGVDRAYSVNINGSRVNLKPYQRVRGSMVVYGANEITPTDDSPFIPAQTFEVEVSLLSRAADDSVIILNPDQAALILWEKVGYAYPKAPDDAGEMRLHTGRSGHVFSDIDYAFREFPDTVSVSSGGGIVYKQRVSELNDVTPVQVVQWMVSQGQTEEMQAYLRAKLRAEDDPVLIHVGSRLLPRGEFLRIAEPKLEARPLLIEWHRAYQSVCEHTPEGDGLEARYREMVAREPENGTLLYLLGRITTDPEEALAVLLRAEATPDPSGYASNAIAYHQLLDGRFTEALEHSERALQYAPDNEQFRIIRQSALYGAGDYAQLENEYGDPLTGDNLDYGAFLDHVYRLGKMGRVELATGQIPGFLDRLELEDEMAAESRAESAALIEAALAVGLGNRDRYVEAVGRIEGPLWTFNRALVSRDLAIAISTEADSPESIEFPGRLALYVLCKEAAREEDAAKVLESIKTELAEASGDMRLWAGWFGDVPPPHASVAAHACDNTDTHYLMLMALAMRHPEVASEYLSRAAAVRYRDSAYSLAVGHLLPK